MATLGLVTVGQTPRDDLTPELHAALPDCDIVEHGALDECTDTDIRALAPKPGEHALASRLADGNSAVFGHDQILSRVAAAIRRAEDENADLVLLACSGTFPELAHRKPLLYTDQLAHHAVAGLGNTPRIGIIRPLPEQLEDARADWHATLGREITAAAAANPYSNAIQETATAASELAGQVDVIVLDCIGFDEQMRRAAAHTAGGALVLLVRGLAIRVTAELLTGTTPTTGSAN